MHTKGHLLLKNNTIYIIRERYSDSPLEFQKYKEFQNYFNFYSRIFLQQERKRNENSTNWKGRNKIVTIFKIYCLYKGTIQKNPQIKQSSEKNMSSAL